MHKLFTLLIIATTIACSTNSTSPKNEKVPEYQPAFVEEFPEKNEYYDISFSINNPDVNLDNSKTPSLSVYMNLHRNSHFVSPYSNETFSGRFSITIEPNEFLLMDTLFVETPRTEETFDPHPFINGYVNMVKENTNYEHQLTILGNEDFEVTGMVSFTIEPSCTFEENPFTISYKSGVLDVRKKKIKRVITNPINPKINTY
jgi:hypothetical protein